VIEWILILTIFDSNDMSSIESVSLKSEKICEIAGEKWKKSALDSLATIRSNMNRKTYSSDLSYICIENKLDEKVLL